MKKVIFWMVLLGFGLLSCKNTSKQPKKGDKLIAKVYDKSLYMSELEGIVPPDVSAQDSALIVSAYMRRWSLDALMMYQAERNVESDSDIDQLVRDYRASLVRFNFEEQLIGEKLDSIVSDAELKQFYESNKDQFQLENTIIRCQIIKVKNSISQGELNKLWNSKQAESKAILLAFADKNAELQLLDTEKWHKLDVIAAILPKGTLSRDNVSKKEGIIKDGNLLYYFRILDVKKNEETAPFEYIKDRASIVILHKRKLEILDKWKEELYDKELRRENIKIF
jgi:hypothetical protein